MTTSPIWTGVLWWWLGTSILDGRDTLKPIQYRANKMAERTQNHYCNRDVIF